MYLKLKSLLFILCNFPFVLEGTLSFGSFLHVIGVNFSLRFLNLCHKLPQTNVLPKIGKSRTAFANLFVDFGDFVSSFLDLFFQFLDFFLGFFERCIGVAKLLLFPLLNIPESR